MINMNPEAKILNLSEVNKMFDSLALTEKEGKSIRMGVVRDAFKDITKAAKANLASHIKTGNLRDSIGVIVKDRKGTVYAAGGARRPKGSHFHIINSGTKTRTTKNGSDRGAVQATNFYDNAVRDYLGKIAETLQESFNARMEKFMKTKY